MKSEVPRGSLALRATDPARARDLDRELDAVLGTEVAAGVLVKLSEAIPLRRVLIAAVEVPGREKQLAELIASLQVSRHQITVSTFPMGDRGKFANINAALDAAGMPLPSFDWLLVVDDDIAWTAGTLDLFLGIAEASGLVIAQPAHRIHSYASHAVTQRHAGSIARRTNLVEIGPFTAFHRQTFSDVLPFPFTR